MPDMNKYKRYRQKLLQRRDDADRLEAGLRFLLERNDYSLGQIRWALAHLYSGEKL